MTAVSPKRSIFLGMPLGGIERKSTLQDWWRRTDFHQTKREAWFTIYVELGANKIYLLFCSFAEGQQQLKSAASKQETPPSRKAVSVPQDKAEMEHLKQACQERDGRIQQLEQEVGKARQALQKTTEKYRELSERETKSVACSTEDLPTMEERFDRSTPRYDDGP